jgi:hypothetical protein
MVSADPARSNTLEKLSWYLGHRQHTVWDQFGTDQQHQMIEEDLLAGKSVSLLLVALITTGLVLSMITVLAVVILL